MIRPDRKVLEFALDRQGLAFGFLHLRFVDIAEFAHAPQDIVLSELGALHVRDRVVNGWGLGEAGEYRDFGQRQAIQGAPKVDLRGGGEPVGALAKKDLV